MKKVLFVCIHNSARSQMAEAFLNFFSAGTMVAESAGLQKGRLNQYVITVMREVGLDISGNKTNETEEFLREGRSYDAVITVCDAAHAETCPVFPGRGKRIAWFFDDPSQFTGSESEVLQKVRIVRDAIRKTIVDFVELAKGAHFWD